MSIFRVKNYMEVPILTGILEFLWLYLIVYYTHKNNLFVSITNVTWNNIITKLLFDYLSMLLIPTIIIIIYKKQLCDFQLCMNSKFDIIVLLGVMIILFFLHNDFGILGLYRFFFYLVVVAFSEEFIYRGFIYNKLKSNSKCFAIIISGVLWGVGHSVLPSIISNANLSQLFLSMFSQIGIGIFMSWYFIFHSDS